MRITHLNKRYWPHVGGVERSLHSIARACVRRGDHVTALVCGGRPSPTRRQLDGVEVIEAPTFGVFQSQPIAPSFLRLPRVPTVWHLHEPFPLGTLAVLLHARSLPSGLPLVVTWHSDVIRQKALKPLHVALARRVLAAARFIHVPAEGHLNSSSVLGEFSEKVRVIPFIVDVDRTRRQPDHPGALSIREWAQGSPVALSVGRLVYYKGIDVLLDALSMTKNLRLLIVGDGSLRPHLEARAIALGLDRRVRWLGALSDDDLVGSFSGADFFVLPSVERAEAFGLVQVEAMAAGLPVISTRLGTSVELVNVDGATGYVVPARDREALAEAIQLMADDEMRRARLAQGALRRAEDFREENLVEQYRALYASALDRSN